MGEPDEPVDALEPVDRFLAAMPRGTLGLTLCRRCAAAGSRRTLTVATVEKFIAQHRRHVRKSH